MNKGIIIKINKDIYTVLSDNNSFLCKEKGVLYKNNVKPVVGDYVIFNKEDKRIEKILERKNYLIRPLVANIDKMFIVTSTHIPVFSSYLLDKFLLIAHHNNIEPIIIFTKEDKLSFKEKLIINKYKKYYKHLGYKVYNNKQIRKITNEFNNSVVALSGQTGAGKTTLLNRIDKTLNLETNEISLSLKRGKHTTRIVELFQIKKGFIIDTPGFSSLDVGIERKLIKNYYKEFEDKNCKYKTCMHIKEDGCEVIKNLNNNIMKERYNNYLKLISEVNK